MTSRTSPFDLQAARDSWSWRGQQRPSFAVTPGPGQESVWDYPRPPELVSDARTVTIEWDGIPIARSTRTLRLLETSHPPTFYLPWSDVDRQWLLPGSGTSSFCEWKGPARYWSLARPDKQLANVAWSYPKPLAGAEAVADCVAFYAHQLDCRVDGQPVRPQAGGFYGGWITAELVGPFKGDPGTAGW